MGTDRKEDLPIARIAALYHRQLFKSRHNAVVHRNLKAWEHPRFFGCPVRLRKQDGKTEEKSPTLKNTHKKAFS